MTLFIFLKTEQREDHKEKNPEINEITESNDKPQPEPESGPTHSENTQEVSADIDINKTEMIPNNDTPTLSEPQDTTSVIYAHEKEPKLPETLILPKLKAKND